MAEREAAARKAGQLLRALDAHEKPLLMVDCGPDGAWRIVFANTPAGERAGEEGNCWMGSLAGGRGLLTRCRRWLHSVLSLVLERWAHQASGCVRWQPKC